MVYQVLLIGAGQLGSRHLQALSLSELPISITVIDPSETSLQTSLFRYKQMGTNQNVRNLTFQTDFENISEEFDICIIATSADCRLQILRSLTSTTKVRNIIFEKLLFQSDQQIASADKLLIENNISAWVNCPRRMQNIYLRLQKLLLADKNIEFTVVGRNWGLACNSIHMIDIWSFLTGETEYVLDTSSLVPKLYESKRSNFKELYGILRGKSGNHKIDMTCTEDCEGFSISHQINSTNYNIKIDEGNGICEIFDRKGHKIETIESSFLFQSQLTHLIVKDIIQSSECGLTPYAESAKLHKLFLIPILNFINNISDENFEICPIT